METSWDIKKKKSYYTSEIPRVTSQHWCTIKSKGGFDFSLIAKLNVAPLPIHTRASCGVQGVRVQNACVAGCTLCRESANRAGDQKQKKVS